jgi:glyoxylase-like metal-dependent hydrolase (beta-lactamase superfamily II)
VSIPFVTLDDPRYGEVVQVSPLIRRVIAHNPSKFTYHGTGTYLVGGRRGVVVIDPGPLDDTHRAALAAAIGDAPVLGVLVTHCHADHVPLAAPLAAETGANTFGFGPHPRLDDPDADDPITGDDTTGDDGTAADGEAVQIEEHTDHDFDPDVRVHDGEVVVAGPGFTITAVHTPGHTSNHLCFALAEEHALFTGDHIMGWSTTVIGPPDGDMRAYLDSIRKVQQRDDAVFWPTHGSPITAPQPFLEAFLAHRLEREANVLRVVRDGVASVPEMVKILYADVREELHKPAGRSVLAHLIKLVDDGVVAIDDGAVPSLKAAYRPV